MRRTVSTKNEIPIKMLETGIKKRRVDSVMFALTDKSDLVNSARWLQKALMNLQSISGVEAIHKQTDILLKKATLTQNNVCALGCGGCCNGNTPVTYIEAKYIESKTGKQLSVSKDEKKGDSCLFLTEKNECSIHQFRPLSCRAKFAVSDWNDCFKPDSTSTPEVSIEIIEPILAAQNLLSRFVRSQQGIGILNINQWFGAQDQNMSK